MASPLPAAASSGPAASSNSQPPLKPIPDIKDNSVPNSSSAPRLLDPTARTTSMPIMRPGLYVPVGTAQAITTGAVQPVASTAELDGWHSAR
jgi:hypothetical protein